MGTLYDFDILNHRSVRYILDKPNHAIYNNPVVEKNIIKYAIVSLDSNNAGGIESILYRLMY